MVSSLVVGLGNPGPSYAGTRHNVGFMLVELLAARHGATFVRSRFEGVVCDIQISGNRVYLGKPDTFMNLSGHFVVPLANYYRIPVDQVLLVHDDMDLPLGRMRLARSGGSGGHRGVQSVIGQFGTAEIARLKVGVGHPAVASVTDWVLSRFTREEQRVWDEVAVEAASAVECWAVSGLEAAMNRHNRFRAVSSTPSRSEQSSGPGEQPIGDSAHAKKPGGDCN